MPKRKSDIVTGAFKAKWDGQCHFCKETFAKGTLIVHWEGSWAELSCVQDLRPPAFSPNAISLEDLINGTP